MVCVPTASDAVEYFATRETRLIVPLDTPSTLKTTAPIGTAVPVFALTVAVKVTVAPGAAGFALETSVVVVAVVDATVPMLTLATNAFVPAFTPTSARLAVWYAPLVTGKSVEQALPVMQRLAA